jgi:hypothetical protein
MFYFSPQAKTVTVKVPSAATAWSTIVSGSPYNETGPYTVCWGNGFRGSGWDGSAMTDNLYFNSSITLTVQYLP